MAIKLNNPIKILHPKTSDNPIKILQPKIEDSRRDRIEEILKSKEPVLFIDGKFKKISKKSRYLLDMLTLED